MFDEKKVREALAKSWSSDTARQWSVERPYDGQCNVTAAIIADRFGGDILKTPWNEVTDHYYNRIDDIVYDLTDAQFAEPIEYENNLSSVDEAKQGFTELEYAVLRSAFDRNMEAVE